MSKIHIVAENGEFNINVQKHLYSGSSRLHAFSCDLDHLDVYLTTTGKVVLVGNEEGWSRRLIRVAILDPTEARNARSYFYTGSTPEQYILEKYASLGPFFKYQEGGDEDDSDIYIRPDIKNIIYAALGLRSSVVEVD